MNIEDIKNVVCPYCDKEATEKTCKEMKCEFCNTDLKIDIEKRGDKIFYGVDEKLSQFKFVGKIY